MYRHPSIFVIKSIRGVTIIVEAKPAATTQLIALTFRFEGRRSPIKVKAIIDTITVPVPSMKEKKIRAVKVGDTKLPIAEIITSNAPVVRSDLCLNLIDRKIIISAVMTSALAFVVLIWAAIPSLIWKVDAISNRSMFVIVFVIAVASVRMAMQRTKSDERSFSSPFWVFLHILYFLYAKNIEFCIKKKSGFFYCSASFHISSKQPMASFAKLGLFDHMLGSPRLAVVDMHKLISC